MLEDGLGATSLVVTGVDHLAQYTVVITTRTNSSCMDEKVTYTFNTGQSECVWGGGGGLELARWEMKW